MNLDILKRHKNIILLFILAVVMPVSASWIDSPEGRDRRRHELVRSM